jgi:hypothetical protein
MVDSDSSLSSPPSTDDEMPVDAALENGSKGTLQKKKQGNILTFFKQKDRSPTPPRKKREPSPEHVYVPEDNPDIAVRTRRVKRVPSRRDAYLLTVTCYVSAMLTFWRNSSLSCSARDSMKPSPVARRMLGRRTLSSVLQRARLPQMSRVCYAPCWVWSSIARSL